MAGNIQWFASPAFKIKKEEKNMKDPKQYSVAELRALLVEKEKEEREQQICAQAQKRENLEQEFLKTKREVESRLKGKEKQLENLRFEVASLAEQTGIPVQFGEEIYSFSIQKTHRLVL